MQIPIAGQNLDKDITINRYSILDLNTTILLRVTVAKYFIDTDLLEKQF